MVEINCWMMTVKLAWTKIVVGGKGWWPMEGASGGEGEIRKGRKRERRKEVRE